MLPLHLASASIGSFAPPESAYASKKCIVRITPCKQVSEHMDVDGMTTENVQTNEDENPSASLEAFWAEYRLLHRKAEITAFLGTETIEDLTDVLPRDLKTVHFSQWAASTLTIAEANRLRRALFAFHAQHNPRIYDGQPQSNGHHASHARGGAASARGAGI